MTSKRTQMTRFSGVFAVSVLFVIVGVAIAQQVGGGGHALDANLRLGSGGYNRPVNSSYLYRPRYAVASTRYIVTNNEEIGFYRSHTALTQQRYAATGYYGTHRYHYGGFPSRSYHRRFRRN